MKKSLNIWHLGIKDVLDFYDMPQKTLEKRLKQPTCPEDVKVKRGVYHLKRINDYFVAHFYGSAENESSLMDEKIRNERAKADINEIKAAREKEKLLPVDHIVQGLSLVYAGVKLQLWSWIKSLPPLMVGHDEKEMRVIFEREGRVILTELSKGVNNLTPKKKKKVTKKKKKGGG